VLTIITYLYYYAWISCLSIIYTEMKSWQSQSSSMGWKSLPPKG
jgi:hypothetical protein